MENHGRSLLSHERGTIAKKLAENGFVGVIRRNKTKAVIVALSLLILFSVIPLPFGQIDDLKKADPSVTAFMKEHERAARERRKAFRVRQFWIPLNSLPKHTIDAMIVAEDGTFWSHSGFDWFEFKESMQRNLAEGRAARGASTITQQLVKNLFLSSSKNPLRKVREWVLTWYMERTLSKSRILEIYLNVIEWGDGIYGIEAASRRYFGKSAPELTRDEATKLAAIIPSPRSYRADQDSRYVLQRASIILERMRARGMVPPDTGVALTESLAIRIDSFAVQLDSIMPLLDSLDIDEEQL